MLRIAGKRKRYVISIVILLVVCINCFCNITVMASELPVIQLETQVDNEEGEHCDKSGKSSIPVIYIMLAIVTILLVILLSFNIAGILKNKKRVYKEIRLDNRKKDNVEIKKEKCTEFDNISECNNKTLSKKNEKFIIQIISKKDYSLYKAEIDCSEKMRDISVGRGERSNVDIRIPIPTVSDKHCVIVKQYQRLYIKDSNSTNGTRYNGKTVEGLVELDRYGVLELGKSQFELRITMD